MMTLEYNLLLRTNHQTIREDKHSPDNPDNRQHFVSCLPCPGLNIPEWFVCPETCPDIVYQVSVYKRQGGPRARGNIGHWQLQDVPCPQPPSPRLWPRVSDGVYSRGPGGIGTLLTEHAVLMIPGNIKIKWIFVSVWVYLFENLLITVVLIFHISDKKQTN